MERGQPRRVDLRSWPPTQGPLFLRIFFDIIRNSLGREGYMGFLVLGIVLTVNVRPLTPEQIPITLAVLAIVLAVFLVWSYLKGRQKGPP